MIDFKQKEFVFDKPVKAGSTGNTAVWNFIGDKSDIEEVVRGCGCTDFKINSDNITATYNASNTPGHPFSKTLTVFLKDGRPLKTIEEKSQQLKYNTNKDKVVLTLRGNII